MLRIGLTGGIASGKSTVANFFAALGAHIIDTDVIARQLVAPGRPALDEIVARFGPDILHPDGSLDRSQLRSQVFADADKRRALERILHPRIREVALAEAEASSAPYVVFVVPLLFETGFDRLVDRTLVVDCPESLQLARLMERDGVSPEQAQAIIASQISRHDRLAAADDVIENSGTVSALSSRVARLHDTYLADARNCSARSGRAE